MRCFRFVAALGSAILLTVATDTQGQVVRQLTDIASSSFRVPYVDDAGSHVYVVSSTNQLGGNPESAFQIFQFVPSTGAGIQVTNLPGGVSDAFQALDVSDDDQWLAFASSADPLGQNHDRSDEVFVVRTDGTGLSQLTADPGPDAGTVPLVDLAGAGNPIAFISDADLTGGNPAHHQQLFVIQRDGTGLLQLTFSDGEFTFLTISDDGTRIAFAHDGELMGPNPDGNYELYAINANGTGLRRLTTFSSGDVYNPGIAGNGSKIVFHSDANPLGTNADGLYEIFVINWDGMGLQQLMNSVDRFGSPASSMYPTLTDDGNTVYFTSNQGTPVANPDGSFEIWKINSNGTGKALVTNASVFGAYLSVSGSGNRLTYANPPFEGDIDEVHVLDATGTNLKQLTLTERIATLAPRTTPSGSRLAFMSAANLTGANPDRSRELFKMEFDGSGLIQLSNNYFVGEPSLSPDGQKIYFSSTHNLLGTNPEGIEEIFRINADGTGLQQLTNASGSPNSIISRGPVVSGNGAVVLFFSTANLTGSNSDLSGEIFKMNPDGSGLVQLTSAPGPGFQFYSYYPRVDDAGVWLTFSGNDNLAGGNPDHSFEVWRMRTDGSGLQQITNTAAQSFYPDISGDGSRIVFSSNADWVGSNPEGNIEVFLYETTTTRQITQAAEGDSLYAAITKDGHWAYFLSDARLFGPRARSGYELYRANLDTGVVERAEGLGFGSGNYTSSENWLQPFPAVAANGNRVAWAVAGDRTLANPDLDGELHVLDRSWTPAIRVSGGTSPTAVSWDVESGPVRYDVIRGDVAALTPGAGGTVDLGAVVCLENNSGDVNTIGNEDATLPAPGQAFFYLYRGSQGVFAGSGSYGKGSGNGERTPSTGDCPP